MDDVRCADAYLEILEDKKDEPLYVHVVRVVVVFASDGPGRFLALGHGGRGFQNPMAPALSKRLSSQISECAAAVGLEGSCVALRRDAGDHVRILILESINAHFFFSTVRSSVPKPQPWRLRTQKTISGRSGSTTPKAP
jgi:hypothetical protein